MGHPVRAPRRNAPPLHSNERAEPFPYFPYFAYFDGGAGRCGAIGVVAIDCGESALA